jgi:hypothetical protein
MLSLQSIPPRALRPYVVPANAGTQSSAADSCLFDGSRTPLPWMPACAGMTKLAVTG